MGVTSKRSCNRLGCRPGIELAPDLIVDNLNDDNKVGTTFDMLWGESFISWQAIGVTS